MGKRFVGRTLIVTGASRGIGLALAIETLDDAEPNVLGPPTLGLHALLYIDHPSTSAALAELVPDLNPHLTGVTA